MGRRLEFGRTFGGNSLGNTSAAEKNVYLSMLLVCIVYCLYDRGLITDILLAQDYQLQHSEPSLARAIRTTL